MSNPSIAQLEREEHARLMNRLTLLDGHKVKLEQQIQTLEERIKEKDEIIKAVAYIGVDFGYGEYQLSRDIIEKARAILDHEPD